MGHDGADTPFESDYYIHHSEPTMIISAPSGSRSKQNNPIQKQRISALDVTSYDMEDYIRRNEIIPAKQDLS